MSRLFVGVLLALTSMVCSQVLAATMVLKSATPAPVVVGMFASDISERELGGNEPHRVRDLDMALYRAHWQFTDTPSGCVETGSANRLLEAATPFSHARIGVLRVDVRPTH